MSTCIYRHVQTHMYADNYKFKCVHLYPYISIYMYICTHVRGTANRCCQCIAYTTSYILTSTYSWNKKYDTLFGFQDIYCIYIYTYIYTYMYDCGSNLLTAILGILSITHFAIPFVPIFFCHIYIYTYIHWFCAYTLTHGCCSLIGGLCFWIKLAIKQT